MVLSSDTAQEAIPEDGRKKRLYSSDCRAEDCLPAAPGLIPTSAKLKLRSLVILYIKSIHTY